MTPDLNASLGQVPWVPLAVAAAFVVFWLVASGGGKKKQQALRAQIEAGAVVIDVRSKSEFASGHYPGAVNLPVDTLTSQLKKLGKPDTSLVVYCASGARSARAAGLLRSAGFVNVTNAGGLSNMPRETASTQGS